MAPELSSNWKKLQAKIKAESSKPATKRKAEDTGVKTDVQASHKRRRAGPKGQAAGFDTSYPKKLQPQPNADSKKAKMGAAQSSGIVANPSSAASPALALWAGDNDISTEDIAQAYGLGLKSNSLLEAAGSARPNEGMASTAPASVGKYVALDCEMVGVGPGGHENALARVSAVDFHGRQVYDSFVRQREFVVDWRTHVSGVGPGDMATARPFDEVQRSVAELLGGGRILVGHDIRHDLTALQLDHPPRQVRDTARHPGFKKYGHGPKPALRVLAQEILGVEIHRGQHSSVEDARVTMLLFRKFKSNFDVEHATRFPDAPVKPAGQKQSKANSTTKKKKKKKKRKN